MYGIFSYTYHKSQPNVGKYSETERLKEIDPTMELGVFAGPKLGIVWGVSCMSRWKFGSEGYVTPTYALDKWGEKKPIDTNL